MLVIYVNHIGRSLRVAALIELVGKDTREILERQCPDRIHADDTAADVLPRPQLRGAGRDRSGPAGRDRRSSRLRAPRRAGYGRVRAGPSATGTASKAQHAALDRKAVLDALRSGIERCLDEDLAYGFRMLVDMAERSLSDSPFLDPTTAVQCLDRLHDGLHRTGQPGHPRRSALRRGPSSAGDHPDHGLGLLTSTSRSTRSASPAPVLPSDTSDGRGTRRFARHCTRRPAPTSSSSNGNYYREIIGDAGLAPADLDFAKSPDGQGIGVSAASGDPSPAGDIARARVLSAGLARSSPNLTDTRRREHLPGEPTAVHRPSASSGGWPANATPADVQIGSLWPRSRIEQSSATQGRQLRLRRRSDTIGESRACEHASRMTACMTARWPAISPRRAGDGVRSSREEHQSNPLNRRMRPDASRSTACGFANTGLVEGFEHRVGQSAWPVRGRVVIDSGSDRAASRCPSASTAGGSCSTTLIDGWTLSGWPVPHQDEQAQTGPGGERFQQVGWWANQ